MTDEASGTVRVERRGDILILTLSFPARRNALSLSMRAVLLEVLTEAQTDPACRVIVLTGEAPHFCAGGDITSFGGVTPAAGRVRMQKIHPLIRLMVAGTRPVIAAVEGAAIGAGLAVASACDIVVASQDAKFAIPFAQFGLVPDFGSMWTLVNRIGIGRMKKLVMSGESMTAIEAERIGLVDQLAPAGSALAEALILAEKVAKGAPLAHEMTKAVLARGAASLDDVLAAEADAQGILYGTEDYKEGYTAFLARRPPVFQGK